MCNSSKKVTVILLFNLIFLAYLSFKAQSSLSLADSIISFYEKNAYSFDFTANFRSNVNGFDVNRGSLSGYKEKEVYFRIKIDSAVSDSVKYFIGQDAVYSKKFVGYNSLRDKDYTECLHNMEELDNRVGAYKPIYIFSPAEFRKFFLGSKQYALNISSLKDRYLIYLIDTNDVYNKEWNINKLKYEYTFEVSKKDYRIHRYVYSSDFVVNGVLFQNSNEYNYSYHKKTKAQIVNYINSFVPFKKLYVQKTIDLQDTISIFPSFSLPDSTSKNYVSSNSASKFTLVEFWYKSCGPCLNNMKRLNSVKDSIDKSILEIVAINDADKLNNDLLKFIGKFNIKYKVLFNGQELKKKLNINAHPSTYIFDNITHRVVYYAKGTSENYSEEIIRHMRNIVH
jgi:hypothetical protein